MKTVPRPTSASLRVQGQGRAVRSLGVVSFLNALPLYEGLLGRPELTIIPDVPARLHELLSGGRCEAALLPVVSFWQAREKLELISDGCIASDGETMTVRVFAKVPPDEVRVLHVDGDSRTSVVLARLLWLELYGRRLEMRPWAGGPARRGQVTPAATETEAVLLIGDKVVRNAPRGFGFEVDLGAAWKHLTGLPFVFAAWYGPIGGDYTELAVMLRAARDAGVAQVERIAHAYASRHGWPVETALLYLRDTMRYTLTADMRTAIDRFFVVAGRHGLLP
jgi:chorismate dehydratase